MDFWFAFDFARIVNGYAEHTGQCLYNALIIKIAKQPTEYLLKVRDALLVLVKFVEDEISERQARDAA